jgi:hypothetical protein
MITIRSSRDISAPTLIGFEATLTTPRGSYEFSVNGPVADPPSPLGGGLFGSISWPRSTFRLTWETRVEQQMFLPHDCNDIALSWQLRGKSIPAQLIIRPYFAGCGPRSFRDIGFRQDAQENGGRLSWLPNVRGPKIIADTNGRYCDAPIRCANELTTGGSDVAAPGSFTFDLGHQPSVLILSTDSYAKHRQNADVGMFLAALLENNNRIATSSVTCDVPAELAAA